MGCVKGIMFDLDGTLLDTLQDIAGAMEAALLEEGLPANPLEAYHGFIGKGLDNLVARAAHVATDRDLAQRLKKGFSSHYAVNWARATLPYTGIVPMLEALAEKKVPLWVHSNKTHEFCLRIIEHFFPHIPFAAVAGSKEGVPLKPAPDAALALIAAEGLEPASVLMVGDMLPDFELARRAGMVSVGALWGFSPEEARRARLVASRPMDVVRFFEGSTDLYVS